MKIYLVCSVRNSKPERKAEVDAYVAMLESEGHKVHYPPRDVNQEDETGVNICLAHKEAMHWCDEVHVFWDVDSKGSHFDLGMAWMAGKKLYVIKSYQEDNAGKSYYKVMMKWNGGESGRRAVKAKVRENRLCFRCGGKGKKLENALFHCEGCGLQWRMDEEGTIDMWLPYCWHLKNDRDYDYQRCPLGCLAVFDEGQINNRMPHKLSVHSPIGV